jgi:hypothetical protein
MTAYATGQQFQVSQAGYLSAIELWIAYAPAGTSGELRIGTSTDLSTYLAAKTFSNPDYDWYKVVFDEPIEVEADTTYYWGVMETGGDLRLTRDNAGGYADGISYFAASSGTDYWTFGSTSATQDFKWRAYLCD